MPRAAFALLWSNLHAGRSFAGYVKNMAKDGRYYWVFVVAEPASNQRFLSVRFKPSTPLLGTVAGLYAQMIAAENAVIRDGGKEKDAIDASLQIAVEALKSLGFPDYDSFAQLALSHEMKAHQEQLALGNHQATNQITQLFKQLEGFVHFNATLQEKTAAVHLIADDFRSHAINVSISAHRYGPSGKGLSVVAGFLGESSVEMAQSTQDLQKNIKEILFVIDTVNSQVSIAHLQMEMIGFLKAEIVVAKSEHDADQLKTLVECFSGSANEAFAALSSLQNIIAQLQSNHTTMSNIALKIEMSQVLGLTETTRIPDAAMLVSMFSEVRVKLDTMRSYLDKIAEVMEQLSNLANTTSSQFVMIEKMSQELERLPQIPK